MPKRKAAQGTYWRGDTLWGRIQVGGKDLRWSLQTDDPEVAKNHCKAERDRQIAIIRFGDARRTFEEVWSEHIARNVEARTATRYAVSLDQLHPYLDGVYLDEIDCALVSEICDNRIGKCITNATIKRDWEGPTVEARQSPMKRFTIDVSQELHSRIKVECARQGINMADELRRILGREFAAS